MPISVETIEEYCNKNSFLKKRLESFKKFEKKSFDIVLENIPDYVQNEHQYNQWLFNEGFEFRPSLTKTSCGIAEILVGYLNSIYRKENNLLKTNRFVNMSKNMI